MTTADPQELAGIDRLAPVLADRLGDERWLDAHAELISGGKSNLTFLVRSDAGDVVLRRPPTGTLLPSAHDMVREARVQRALADTDVPVARIVLADEGELIGIQCYVMERVPGHVIRGELPPSYAGTAAERTALAHAFADTLAHLHAVEFDAVGLGDYGRPEGFMERQVRRWAGQWEKSRTHDVPEIEELGRRLAADVPAQQRSTIVHGDFRIDNVVYSADDPGTINAVLDWELSTLGDPLTDLALLMLFWREEGEGQLRLIPGVTHLPGFPTRHEMLERYAATSGADLSDLGYYQAFAHYKFAIIAQGVQARARAGAMGGQDFGNLDDEIRELGALGLEHL
ncbi:MAG TPA: phosphotransferase family protein [Marmoricola sp.]|jgi:aminoglycoside phosphotransferase (APT) family kinase protein|nr:phosphotransferase family protein [Marmoricola sp.]